jgi:phospholipid/cholesterol/gamma-HCH transport system substrate-binding protein
VSSSHHFRRVLFKLIAFAAASLLITSVLVETLLDLHLEAKSGFEAAFTNVSGLQPGDTVRVAGVEVGKVGRVRLSGDHAIVSFSVDSTQHLTTTTMAEIHFENVLGQRFLALVAGPPGGQPLKSGATIPLSRTQPALDLTGLFNGFQPLFAALTPKQVNQLTGSIIQVFQGESNTVSNLVSQTAALTSNLADRQKVIDEVLINLSNLLNSVGGHDQQLGQLIDQFSSFVNGLAGQRAQIGSTIDGVKNLTTTLSNILNQSQPILDKDINGLASATALLAANQQGLDRVLQAFPGFLTTLNKVSSSGSYLSVFICNLTLQVQGQANISLIPGVIPPAQPPFLPGDPVKLPGGAVGDQAQNVANCRP